MDTHTFFVTPLNEYSIIGALLAGYLCGTLGPYLVWKRLGLLSDSVAHASMLLIALSLFVGISSSYLVIPFAVLIGWGLFIFQERKYQELDSIIAVLFAGLMGLGVILLNLSGQHTLSILPVLFGDIQNVTIEDIGILLLMNIFVSFYVIRYKKELNLLVLNPELALVEGVSVKKHSRFLLILCSVTVAVCLKLMGVVLVTILFVAPALSSQAFSKSLKQNMILSSLLGVFISLVGVFAAKTLMLPGSPTIATVGLLTFLISAFFRR